MADVIRIMVLNENASIAETILRELRQSGFEPHGSRVETEPQFLALLAAPLDLVVAAFSMQRLNAKRALEILRSRGQEIPLIVVSGGIGEEDAVAAIKMGATNYLHQDRLGRLGPVVRNVLQERRFPDRRRTAVDAPAASKLHGPPAKIGTADLSADQQTSTPVRRTEEQMQAIIRSALDCIISIDQRGRIVEFNPAAERTYGYLREEILGKSLVETLIPETSRASHSAEFYKLLTTGRHCMLGQRIELSGLRADGTVFPVEIAIAASDSPSGPAFTAFVRDITDRRRTEVEIRNSESNLRKLTQELQAETRRLIAAQSVAKVGSWETDLQTLAVVWSAETYRIFEVDPATFTPTHDVFLGLVHPDDRARVDDAFRQSFLSQESCVIDHRLLLPDHNIKFVEERWQVIRDDCDQPVSAIGTCQDITERRQAELEMRRVSDLLKAVADQSPDAMFVKDHQGRYLLFNPAAARFVGRDAADVIGRDDTALFDQAGARRVMERDRRVMASGKAEVEEEELTAAGTTRTYLATKAPFVDSHGKTVGVIGISSDITERKRIEQQLRVNEAKLAEAIRIAQMGYWSRDLTTDEVEWSDELHEIFGVDRDSFGRTFEAFLAIVHPEDRDSVRATIAGAREDFSQSYRIVVNGEIKAIHERACVISSSDGRRIRVVGTAQDVTDQWRVRIAQKQAQESLRLRERAMHAVSQGILITDALQEDNPIIYASPSVEMLTGYSAAEVLGRNCRFLQGPATAPDTVQKLRQAIQQGLSCSVELVNYRKDGTPFWNALSISPIHDDEGNLTHFVASQADITERLRMESQLHQMQKMEAMGRLAGGIAHDFNNLLTIINGYSELLLKQISNEDPRAAFAEQIKLAGDRAAGLTQQLLAFSRRQVVQPIALDLNTVIANLETMLQRLIGEDIEIDFKLHSKPLSITADRGQMEQVLLNLCLNARDAMPRGGTLTIETEVVELDDTYAASHPDACSGIHVMVAVSDTGCGMAKSTLAQIFEPFFTTKPPDKGTGLGLATVYGIVRQTGGHIEVCSEFGSGTTFKIYLPSRSGEEQAFQPTTPEPPENPRGTETILLVEDEAGVRALAARFLKERGYQILEAGQADDALKVYARRTSEIQLVITDVVMPGMSGRELVEQLRQQSPDLKVIYMSAYTEDAIVRNGVLRSDCEFVQKPFTSKTLSTKVRAVLDSATPG